MFMDPNMFSVVHESIPMLRKRLIAFSNESTFELTSIIQIIQIWCERIFYYIEILK